MKRIWRLILSLTLVLCMTACVGGSEGGIGEKSLPNPSGSGTTSAAPVSPGSLDQNADSLSGTYWTAVRYESYNDMYGRTEVSQMPTDRWWADLFLNEDGTAQFREVVGDCFNIYMADVPWIIESDNTLRLKDESGDAEYDVTGRLENGCLILEIPYEEVFYLEEAERPGPGGELCPANLNGVWRMTRIEENGRQYNAREEGIASMLLFSSIWRDWDDGRYTLQADYYFANSLDTDEPEYRQALELWLKPLDRPLFEGISNELWSAQLSDEATGLELFLTLTDPDTLYLQEHDQHNGSASVRTAVYERADSLLPESLRDVLYEEPDDSLIFYWPNPPENISAPLEAMTVTKLEENGRDKLLVVGSWYGTRVMFCTGKGIWDDDGTLLDWIADETVYDGTVNMNDPLWFSLTIPEGEPNLCMHINRSWDDMWFLWPITNTNGYLISEGTYLTPLIK